MNKDEKIVEDLKRYIERTPEPRIELIRERRVSWKPVIIIVGTILAFILLGAL